MTVNCRFCARSKGDEEIPGDWIMKEAQWSASILAGLEVPGWFVLQANSHVEGFWSMSDEEATTYGATLRRIAKVLGGLGGGKKVYTYSMGERYPHLHVIVGVPGLADGNLRGGDLIEAVLRKESSIFNAEKSLEAAVTVRDALKGS